MDSNKTKSKPNPRETANIVSVLLWWWTVSLFKTGYRKALETEDLFDPLKVDRSNLLGDRLEKRWKIELEKSKKPSLLKTIFRTFLWEYSVLGLVQILNEFVIRLGTPLLLGGLLRYFRKDSVQPYETALWFAAGICIASAMNVISGNQAIFGAFHVGAKVRIAVCSVVYRKALRLSNTALGETAPGKVVNLVANDVNRFDLVSIFIHYMWSAPLSALIVAYILYHEVGYPGLIGIAAVFVVVPLQSYTGKLSSKFRMQTAIKTDERVRLMDEIISGAQVIKMYAWEKPFCAMVELARRLELQVVTKSSYIRGIYMTFNLFTTRMALYCTLISMLMFGMELSADKVFVFSSYFNILAQTMTGMFVRGFAELAECMVAIRRLENFLTYDEFRGSNIVMSNRFSNSSNVNSESKQIFHTQSRQDIPFIDEDAESYEVLNESNEKKKQNGLIIVANELLKNTADLVDRRRSSTYNDDSWAIKMVNVTAKWNANHSENTLNNLNLNIEKGKLYGVIGMVGSGKSSFLSAILGEINLLQGQVKVNGNMSYASQEAWVFGSSIRQNILFGQAYERHRYQRVVKACALLRDFKQFPQGDQTIVGERGSSLSGGQKARINLARALYRQSDICLLDDPLSAVDAHVSKHLFQECVQKYLAGKTRILATHQLQYMKDVDAIILLEQGKMKYFSHYQDLLNYRPEYSVLLVADDGVNDDSSTEKSKMRRQFSSSSNKSRTPEASSGGTDDEEEDEDAEKLNNGLEGTSRGVVKGPIFIKFFQTGANLYMAFLVLLLFIITQFFVSLNDYFVPVLINAEETRHYLTRLQTSNRTDTNVNVTTSVKDMLPVTTYIYIYTGLVLSVFFIGITRSLFFFKTCIKCSQRLHDMMFSALIRTGMRFFDTNPSGRILNRFSKDMGAIDELLPKAILDAGQLNMMMLGSLIVSCVVNPIFLVPVVFIGVLFYWIRKVYLKTSKNVKRLEGITRSPVFTHLNATLNGLTTIRAYCAQDILKREFDKMQDTHTSTAYMHIVTSTAFGFSLDVFCFIFTSLVTFSFLLLSESFSGGEVGLAITQVMAMTGLIQWGMRQSAEVANQMMAVERVLEYIQLPPEPNLKDRGMFLNKKDRQSITLPADVPKNWPTEGDIKFKNVYMRYTEEDPPVLKDLNIVICPGEKIGVVGRTGAGKSSLISALFRLAKVEGIIEIDGRDTGLIALEDLRRKISIIPQDPVLFSGTIRRNLDPFNEFPDKDLWEVLEEVELKDAIASIGNGLDARVFDRGSNYSVGQKQLVCLARAILRNNRILMLDEATANVDPHTDALIQRTIRTKFATCTMLTVAHRLNTIMDSDKVLVMDKGRMAEYDHPHVLLQNNYSQFTSLVKETGQGMHDQLVKVAKQSYIAKCGKT